MPKAVPIIKLHGSVNWFRYGNERNLVASTLMGKYPDGVAIDDPAFRIDNLWKMLKSYLELKVDGEPFPAIIPPMLGKMSVSPGIAAQWRAAIHFLETAAQVVIIGYSFPETDAFMTRLLAEGLKNNNGLEGIKIVNIQAGAMGGKARTDFHTNFQANEAEIREIRCQGLSQFPCQGWQAKGNGGGLYEPRTLAWQTLAEPKPPFGPSKEIHANPSL